MVRLCPDIATSRGFGGFISESNLLSIHSFAIPSIAPRASFYSDYRCGHGQPRLLVAFEAAGIGRSWRHGATNGSYYDVGRTVLASHGLSA